MYDSTNKALLCRFLGQFNSGETYCSANITYGESCQHMLGFFNSTIVQNESQRSISPTLREDSTKYCYTVYTGNGAVNLIIEGSFICGNAPIIIVAKAHVYCL